MIKTLDLNNSNEVDAVMQIWLNENIHAHPFVDEQYWHNNYQDVKEALQNAQVYLYLNNNEILGFIGIIEQYIAGLFVAQKAQNQGVGTTLLNYIKAKYSTLTLEVYTQNQKAVSFYQHQGFKIQKEELEKQTQHPEYLMEWNK